MTLVDTGCGGLFGPQCGKMISILAEKGINPQNITRLLFTHLHGDHCGGALIGGNRVFANAAVYLHPAEAAHWKDGPAAQVLAAYADQIMPFTPDLGRGLRVWDLPGHTPGHIGLRLGHRAVLVGDIFHSLILQAADPTIYTKYDHDPALAAITRRLAMQEIADRGLVFAGGHSLSPHKFQTLTAQGVGFLPQQP